MNNNYNDMHGFSVLSVTECREIGATVVKMIHERSGASLVFLDRPDPCKTFAIGFRTVPSDDTGVFHILEHCVLSGSDKFPVKDPFTHLLKSTVYSYMNALTYSDKTLYPVSSLNKKAFLGLVDVYMDAVLHPLVLKDKSIFLSEGCRIEEEDGEVSVGGVVYNEMQGAYSSPDELCELYISDELFSGSFMAYDSGGDPRAIPELDYSELCRAHERYYHPSNSCIFLDGTVPLWETLALLDSYLQGYTRRDPVPFPSFGEVRTGERTEKYYAESPDGENRLILANRLTRPARLKERLSLEVLLHTLSDTNTARLKSAILSTGLCDNMYVDVTPLPYDCVMKVCFIGVKDGAREELIQAYDKALADILDGELDKERLRAAIRRMRFLIKEEDHGSTPKGIDYLPSVIDAHLYGLEYSETFPSDELLSELEDELDGDYFKRVLRTFIEADRASVLLLATDEAPLTDPVVERARERVSALGDSEKKRLLAELDRCHAWQTAEDTDEAIATLPKLSVSDLASTEPDPPTEVYERDGATVIAHDMDTSGITYTELFFDASDLTDEEVKRVVFMCMIYRELGTGKRTVGELKSDIELNLGTLSILPLPQRTKDGARFSLRVDASTLDGGEDKLGELVAEYLTEVSFDDRELIKRKLEQLYVGRRNSIINDPLSICIRRVNAPYSTVSMLNELILGYSMYDWLRSARGASDECIDALIRDLYRLRERIFRRGRLTVSAVGRRVNELCDALLPRIPEGGERPAPCSIPSIPRRNEAIVVPGTVSYTAYGSSIAECGESYRGSMNVMTTVASYELLWNEIRVKGGAYDAGLSLKYGSGSLYCYSYRDPSPLSSLELYRRLGDELRRIASELCDLTPYVISTYGNQNGITTPKMRGMQMSVFVMGGIDAERRRTEEREMLETDREELLRLSDMLTSMRDSAVFCIAAPKDVVDTLDVDNLLVI